MSPLAFYKQMIEAGVPHDVAMPIAEKFEAEQLAETLEKLAAQRAKAAEKKRRQRAASPGTPGDTRGQAGTDGDTGGQRGTKDAPAPTCARVRDISPRLVISGSDDADVARARDQQSDDWPAGSAKDHARLLIAEVGSPWLDPHKSLDLNTTIGRLAVWKREGASWTHDVVPTVAKLCERNRKPVKSWKFFDSSIAQSIADNRAALAIPEAQVVPLRPGGGASIADREAAIRAEARRRVLES